MATKKDKELVEAPIYDFSDVEQARIDAYIKDGCPGYKNVRPDKRNKWIRLYRAGKNYEEISKIAKVNLDLVLYTSFKHKWTQERALYFSDLANSAMANVKNIHSQSIKTMSTIVSAFSLYFEEKFGKYISVKDTDLIESVDPKILNQYYKSLEVMSKMYANTQLRHPSLDKKDKEEPKNKTHDQKDENVFEVDFNENDSGDVLLNLAKKGME